MEIAELKLRLIRLILEIDNQEVLLKVLEILEDFQKNNHPDLSPEQITEIDRRLQELENGEVELLDADEVMAKLRNELLLQLLRQRSEEAKQNPELVLTSEESRKRMMKRFNWHGKI